MADLSISIGAQDNASPHLRLVGDSAKEMGEKVAAGAAKATKETESFSGVLSGRLTTSIMSATAQVRLAEVALRGLASFAVSSVSAFLEQEHAQKSLALALKNVGETSNEARLTMNELAEAFENQTGVQSETVLGVEKMLVQMGIAVGDIGNLTGVVLDLSAAMGTDAETAARQLASAIETGNIGALGRYLPMLDEERLQHDAINELLRASAKLHGQAAESMTGAEGSAKRLGIAWDNFLRGTGEAIVRMSALKHPLTGRSIADDLDLVGLALQSDTKSVDELSASLKNMEKNASNAVMTLDEVDIKGRAPGKKGRAPGKPGDRQEAEDSATDFGIKTEARRQKMVARHRRNVEKEQDEEAMILSNAAHKQANEEERRYEESLKEMEKRNAALAASTMKARQDFMNAGVALGSTFVYAIGGEIENAIGGQDFNIAEAIAAMLPSLVEMALAGTPAAPFAPIVGAALRMGVRSISQANRAAEQSGERLKPPKHLLYADGGWVDGVQYLAEGGSAGTDTVPAMLTPGERVLSRSEIAGMGGPGGVESAVRGRGAQHIYINTMDAQSFRGYIGGRGGSSMASVINDGRGEFAQRLRRAGIK